MKIKIWGCRGSIPAPGKGTLRHGGNTTCIEIRTASGELIIVDAGSGLRLLGKAIRKDESVTRLRLFLTHSHWDHIMGFPFFEPAYFPKYTLSFCGGIHAQDYIRRHLTKQMEAPYFPVEFNQLKARFEYSCENPDQKPGPCMHPGSIEIEKVPLSHPNGGYGFKFTADGSSFVFLTDNELSFKHGAGLSTEAYAEFCRGADLLLHDAQYTDKEYGFTKGWGHSTFKDATEMALAAGAKRLGLFHHDPERTDDDLDRQTEMCREHIQKSGSAMDCFASVEGLEISL